MVIRKAMFVARKKKYIKSKTFIVSSYYVLEWALKQLCGFEGTKEEVEDERNTEPWCSSKRKFLWSVMTRFSPLRTSTGLNASAVKDSSESPLGVRSRQEGNESTRDSAKVPDLPVRTWLFTLPGPLWHQLFNGGWVDDLYHSSNYNPHLWVQKSVEWFWWFLPNIGNSLRKKSTEDTMLYLPKKKTF